VVTFPLLPPMPSGPDQFQLFSQLVSRAVWTGRRQRDGIRLGVPQDEETITNSVLLDLRLMLHRLQVITLTHREESRTGADWVWWWQGYDRWFGFLVQAKRLHAIGSAGHGYDLGYRPTATSGTRRGRQIDTLINTELATGLPATYVLYGDPSLFGLHAPCPLLPSMPGADGVMVLDARVARWVLDHCPTAQVPIGDVVRFARPWSCLVTCRDLCTTWSARSSPPHAEIVSDLGFGEGVVADDCAVQAAIALYLSSTVADLGTFYLSQRRVPNPHTGNSIARFARAVRQTPPAYVTAALNGELLAPASPDADQDLTPERLPSSVRYLVVLSRDHAADSDQATQ
jgi:hypothetical protein